MQKKKREEKCACIWKLSEAHREKDTQKKRPKKRGKGGDTQMPGDKPKL